MTYSYSTVAHFNNSELTVSTNDIYLAIDSAVKFLSDKEVAVDLVNGFTGELLMYRDVDGDYYFTDEMRLMFAGFLRI